MIRWSMAVFKQFEDSCSKAAGLGLMLIASALLVYGGEVTAAGNVKLNCKVIIPSDGPIVLGTSDGTTVEVENETSTLEVKTHYVDDSSELGTLARFLQNVGGHEVGAVYLKSLNRAMVYGDGVAFRVEELEKVKHMTGFSFNLKGSKRHSIVCHVGRNPKKASQPAESQAYLCGGALKKTAQASLRPFEALKHGGSAAPLTEEELRKATFNLESDDETMPGLFAVRATFSQGSDQDAQKMLSLTLDLNLEEETESRRKVIANIQDPAGTPRFELANINENELEPTIWCRPKL